MFKPKSQSPRGIKRSASSTPLEPANKRPTIRDSLTPSGPHDGEQRSSERKLTPVISRAETALQFEHFTASQNSGNAIKDEADDSDDEFVDAQEDVNDDAMFGMWTNEDADALIVEAGAEGASSSEQVAETQDVEMLDAEMKEPDWEPKELQSPKIESKKEMRLQKIKPEPETIDLDSDTEDVSKQTSSANKAYKQEDGNSDEDMTTSKQASPEYEDLFDQAFGGDNSQNFVKKESQHSSSIDGEIDTTAAFSMGLNKKGFVSGTHKSSLIRSSSPSSTPPPSTSRPIPVRRRPDIRLDLSRDLLKHSRFHDRVIQLIPRLPAYETLDWTRRYWIAVLIEGKRVNNVSSEKDLVWMRGNKFSTVETVFHSYALAVMADPNDLALLLGTEAVEMEDQMQSLDYFGDRLVVFRAVKRVGNEREAAGKSLVANVVPEQAVIAIDLD